ncbi:MAG: methionine adenosyltransferase domain-containing protein, partial [Nanoarchaeota archaeon]|nr:methionine adenosyltransferase domain-containing protein [Nanoarchaeota archaeon]
YIAKNLVAAGLVDICEVQLAYSIGVAEPTSILIDDFETGKVSSEELSKIVRKEFPIKPADIISVLDLKRPIYADTAAYGHFGRNEFPWENTKKAEKLKKYL